MSNITYDEPRIEQMQDFLEYIYDIFSSNSEFKFSDSVVYRELCRCGLKDGELNHNREYKKNIQYFDEWINEFKDSNSLNAFWVSEWSYWVQFTSNAFPKSPYIKLYIPIDSKHIEQGAVKLFKFVEQLGVNHASKIGRDLRSDSIIIRLPSGCEKQAKQIIDYINQNPFFKNGLNETNPFIPCIDNIGFMYDTGISYNSEIAKLITKYIYRCISEDKKPTINQFYKDYINNDNLLEILYEKQNDIKQIQKEFRNAAGIKSSRKINPLQKKMLLMDAIKATYLRYGPEQVKVALLSIIKDNNYNLISNGATNLKYRQLLQEYLPKEEIEEIITKIIRVFDRKSEGESISQDINKFIHLFFEQDIVIKFNDICLVTMERHGGDWLVNAIKQFIKYDKADGFTRYISEDNKTINYREEASKIGALHCLDAMKGQLYYLGLQTPGLSDDEVIEKYVGSLMESRYASVKETSGFVVK